MNSYIFDWLNLLVRWGHLIAGVAWIGTSFYFVALDLTLQKPAGLPKGVAGESWEVHGGGFYHVQKYLSAPPSLPEHLTWFKWEAYLTWVTGFLLLVLQYYINAESYLIDPSVMALSNWQAIGISVASIIAGWAVYDLLCRSPLGQHLGWLFLSVFALIMLASYGFTHVFSGRGAFIHIGVFIGTIMAANVFMVIIPNQRKITASLLKGETPDPLLGATGKQRSFHNTYLTLPVLLMMVSNHYAFVTNAAQSWLLVGVLIMGGAVLRYFLLRTEVGDDHAKIAWTIPVMGSLLAVAMYMTMPVAQPSFAGDVSDADALGIVTARCSSCHAAEPSDPTIKAAPKGVVLESVENMKRHAAAIMTQAVVNKAMPMGNKTGMTSEERAKLSKWLQELK